MLKRVVIKEELVELTGDYRPAIILNQFIYWTERMKDTDKYIQEETERALKENIEVNIESSKGWIYKTSEELNEEIMLNMSNATIRKYIKQLIEKGYIQERRNPKYKWDKTMQYRVDIYKIQLDLAKLGYALEGYKLLPGIKILDIEEIENGEKNIEIDEEILEPVKDKKDNKKAPVSLQTEAEELEVFSNSNKNSNTNNISQKGKKENNENIKNKKIDYEQMALERCKKEIPGFDDMPQFRKDVNIGIMLQRIAKGE